MRAPVPNWESRTSRKERKGGRRGFPHGLASAGLAHSFPLLNISWLGLSRSLLSLAFAPHLG